MTTDPMQPRHAGLLGTVARRAGVVTVFVLAALLGTLSGVLFAYADDLPEITALDNYKPSTITRLLARDGQTIGEFATERRLVVTHDLTHTAECAGDERPVAGSSAGRLPEHLAGLRIECDQ